MTTSYQQSSHNHKNVFNNSGNRLLIKSHGKNLTTLTNGSLNSEQIHHNNHRRYSSSTSLQNEFNGFSSVSPISSSSPQPNNAYSNRSISIITANNCSVINNGHGGKSMIRMNSASNLRSMKRWSASQEIRSSMDHIKYDFF